MCGIAGFIQCGGGNQESLNAVLHSMTSRLAHRGPDADGYWLDSQCGVALGHRRLSVLDLSAAGAQPMQSSSRRFVITFNGEIYNFSDLREELEALGHRFRGHSDTEVMLAGFDQWGVASTTERLNGMFAFAVWDKDTQVLILGRDRMGEKPLYFGWMNNCFLFASELKAISAHPRFEANVDTNAVAAYVRRNYIPGPLSIYRGISKLHPGTLVEVTATWPGSTRTSKFWDLERVATEGMLNQAKADESELVNSTEELLRDAIRRQMVADVPLGAFLSGGVDSSTIVSLMQAQSSRPVRTFTIGFNEREYDESSYARAVASHLGTDHTDLVLSPSDALRVIPDLPTIYDEPLGDPSQLPTVLVARLARSHVTVVLSGDGGDELFGGYVRYQAALDAWKKLARVPYSVRRIVAGAVPKAGLKKPSEWLASYLASRYGRRGTSRNQLEKIVALLGADTPLHLYESLTAMWLNADVVQSAQYEQQDTSPSIPQSAGFLEQMMFHDQCMYLPSDILQKVDRACMSVGLESRVPLLDYRMVEASWRVPSHLRVHASSSKWILREILRKYVPDHLIDRPKLGFSVPFGRWLRNELRDWAESLLDSSHMRSEGFLNSKVVQETWREHVSGRQNWQHHLWNILSFQAWLRSQDHNNSLSVGHSDATGTAPYKSEIARSS